MRILHVEDDENHEDLSSLYCRVKGGRLSPWKTQLQRALKLAAAGGGRTGMPREALYS
jgi:hypothetical protein